MLQHNYNKAIRHAPSALGWDSHMGQITTASNESFANEQCPGNGIISKLGCHYLLLHKCR